MTHSQLPVLLPAALLLLRSFLNAADIPVQSPKDYQVFQRTADASGTVRIQGKGIDGADAWQYRFLGTDFSGRALSAVWQDFPAAVDKGKFDFWTTAPAGGWYQVEIRALKNGTELGAARVEHVGVGEVFLVAGQSNAANHGSEKQSPRSGMVSSFNGGSWRTAEDPQHGASGNSGSFMPAFGDAIAAKFKVPVGLVPVAVGGTSVREWLPEGDKFPQQTTTGKGVRPAPDGQWESNGVLYATLTARLEQLGNRGVRAILWHQGESDAGQARGGYPADRQISGEQYAQFLKRLVEASRRAAGWQVPWFTAQTTYHSEKDPSDAEFRTAQSSLWKEGITLEGPDTDALRAEHRQGVHFNAAGLQKHGELWAEKVSPWLAAQKADPVSDGPPHPGYRMVWNDEFDGTVMDPKKWKHRYPGPRKDGFNDPSAVALDGRGHLAITCSRKEDKIMVGMICTEGLFETRYGYVEARVQMQTQEGWWPGFWMTSRAVANPDKGTGDVDDTARNGTEIDIFEYLRRRGDQIQHALHWNGYGTAHKSTGSHPSSPGLTKGFHTVGCEWTPDSYTFYVDGRKTWETSTAVSRVPQYLILSGEVSSWPGDISRASLPDSVIFDYVRVWQKEEPR
jgi:beta-glucanase (GH16 family)